MSNLLFTADLHFNHEAIIWFCNRPFEDVEQMNETLIVNWNSKATEKDIIYVVGDFGFGHLDEIISQLNGKIKIVPAFGGHDKAIKKLKWMKKIEILEPMVYLEYEKQGVVLNHYCQRIWHRSHWGAWHFYAHSHCRLEPIGKSIDVGVDCHNYHLWTWDEIKKYMEARPDNPNFVGDGKNSI